MYYNLEVMSVGVTEPRIRVRHLRTFLEVARQQGVGRAAGMLHVSQPAVTKSVQELEGLLGAALFFREGDMKSARSAFLCASGLHISRPRSSNMNAIKFRIVIT
jgi:hypothetical protein